MGKSYKNEREWEDDTLFYWHGMFSLIPPFPLFFAFNLLVAAELVSQVWESSLQLSDLYSKIFEVNV